MNRQLILLQERIGYTFSDPALLLTAMTHPSAMRADNYERLEFLGDAVLELAVSEMLYLRDLSAPEGVLTKRRSRAVCSESLAGLARKYRLGECLILGNGELKSGGADKPSILENAFEALMGAIYLDSDFDTVKSIISDLLADVAQNVTDYKSMLQEYIQHRKNAELTYHLTEKTGPQHNPSFSVSVRIGGEECGCGTGKSKKQAEQNAARAALKHLNIGGK